MSFIDLCKQRHSVRSFSDRPVEPEKLALILEAGRMAPSALNKQPQRIYVLESEAARARLAGVTRMTYGAPLILLVCYDAAESWKNTPETFGEDYDSGEMDATIVGTQMMDMAADLGLGTLWARGFNARQVHELFELPENVRVCFFLDVGYPAEETVGLRRRSPRKPFAETVTVL